MTEKTFYVFRHGQTDWNKQHRIQGHTDTSLNEQGKLEASQLALKLKNIAFDCFYSSDLSRARQSAEIVIQGRSIPLHITAQLRETHMGEAEGMTVEEAMDKFGADKWNSFRQSTPEALKLGFPGGETRGESLNRLREFFLDCANKADGHKNIGIATHGGSLRSLLHSFLPDNTPALAIPNCVVYKLYQREGQWLVEGPL